MSICPERRLRTGAVLACVALSMLAACGREAAKPAPVTAATAASWPTSVTRRGRNFTTLD